jgi:hypothetical protein
MNKIPVTLKKVKNDDSCQPYHLNLVDIMEKSTERNKCRVSTDVSLFIHNAPSIKPNEGDTSMNEHITDRMGKDRSLRSDVSLFSNHHEQIVSEEHSDGIILSSGISLASDGGHKIPVEVNHNILNDSSNDHEEMHLQDNIECIIRMATLVEENLCSRFKMKYYCGAAIVLVALIVGVGTSVRVSTSKEGSTAQVTSPEDDCITIITAKEIKKSENHTFWAKAQEIGERAFYLGSACNPYDQICLNSNFGFYEVDTFSNQVIRACSWCKNCGGGN